MSDFDSFDSFGNFFGFGMLFSIIFFVIISGVVIFVIIFVITKIVKGYKNSNNGMNYNSRIYPNTKEPMLRCSYCDTMVKKSAGKCPNCGGKLN